MISNSHFSLMNRDENLKNRFEFIDIAKSLLIILMVIGHSGSPITNLIYLFHMPSFIFLSGFLYNECDNYFKKSILKKIKSLYIPYIKYQTLFLMFTNFFVYIGIYSKQVSIKSFKEFVYKFTEILSLSGGGGELLGPLWFIVLLIEVSILYIFIQKLSTSFGNKYINTNLTILIILSTGFILNYLGIQIPRYLDTAMIALGIYHLGFLYKKNISKVPMKFGVFIVMFIVLISFSQFGSINIGIDMYVNPVFFAVSFLTGTYVILYTSYFIVNNTSPSSRSRKILVSIGRNTLFILALHLLTFKLVTLCIVIVRSYPYSKMLEFPVLNERGYLWILYSVSGIVFPMLIKLIMNICKELYIKGELS